MVLRPLPTLTTDRLVLKPLANGSLEAWLRPDRRALARSLGVVFPDVEGDPPMVGADLLEVRASMRPGRTDGWWIWISAVRDLGVAVGTLAVDCVADPDGSIRIAHWTYPQWQGRAFAREAADTIASWMLQRPPPSGPPGHHPGTESRFPTPAPPRADRSGPARR